MPLPGLTASQSVLSTVAQNLLEKELFFFPRCTYSTFIAQDVRVVVYDSRLAVERSNRSVRQ